jgi:hypothetical protein
VLEIFRISRSKHFIQLRTWWGSFQTWSWHINDLLIEMCLVSHYLWRQITHFLESWVTPGLPGHRGRVTLQHTDAYRVTRTQVSGHPPQQTHWAGTGQTGACHRLDRWPPVHTYLVTLSSLSLECVDMLLIKVLRHRQGNALLESH